MLKWLFGEGRDEAVHGEDSVWMTHAARLAGVSREAKKSAEAGKSVLVVAFALTALDELEAALAARQPTRCADIFAKDTLRMSLSRAGSAAIALSGALPSDPRSAAGVAVEILVYGRNDSRAADEAIVRFADALGPSARVSFHVSLDDPLLQTFAGSLKPLLEKLGMREDEPIAHAMATRAIRNAQEKGGG